jgi:hypothetical protein
MSRRLRAIHVRQLRQEILADQQALAALTAAQPEPEAPKDKVQVLLNHLYGCRDCLSEVHWNLQIGLAHDEPCPKLRGVI